MLVELRHEGDDATEIYLVGSIEERHDTYDVVSTSSPLGQALLGAAPGATVTYQGPRRELSVEVVSVASRSLLCRVRARVRLRVLAVRTSTRPFAATRCRSVAGWST